MRIFSPKVKIYPVCYSMAYYRILLLTNSIFIMNLKSKKRLINNQLIPTPSCSQIESNATDDVEKKNINDKLQSSTCLHEPFSTVGGQLSFHIRKNINKRLKKKMKKKDDLASDERKGW